MLQVVLLYALAPVQSPTVQDVLDAKVREIQTRTGTPGISAAVVLPDGTTLTSCAGFADSQKKTPMRPEHAFCAGSTGKMLVGAAIAQSVVDKKLDLDQKIAPIFSEDKWFETIPNSKSLTLRHLLNHTSGLGDHVYNKAFLDAVYENPDRVWKAEDLVTFLADTKPLFEAGKGWAYSDTNYVLAGLILERTTGEPLFTTIKKTILEETGLEEVWPALSRTHENLCDGLSMEGSPLRTSGWMLKDGKLPFNPQMEHGGGGTFATPRGLARWAAMLYGGRVVSDPALRLIVEGVPAKLGPGQKYGLGCMIRPTPAGLSYGHGGWFPGYLSDVMYLVSHKAAVAVQLNTDDMRALKGSAETFNREIVAVLFSKG